MGFGEVARRASEHFQPTYSIRGQLVTKKSNKNVSKCYEKLDKIGDGSISTIYRVARKGRKGATNGNGNNENSSSLIKKLLMICPSYDNEETPKICYAMKQIDLKRVPQFFIEELKNEIEILKTLDHPNIIRAYETYEKGNQLSLIMELCTGGDLFSRMKTYTEGRVLTIIQQVLRAISYMHNLDVIHRDLKFENILFENTKKNSQVKLIDFGLSVKLREDESTTGKVGTIYTMAPEVLKGDYTTSADLWGVGVITFILLSGKKPFWGKNKEIVEKKIRKCNYNFDGPSWKHVSQEAKDFISSLIKFKPEDRLTAEQALRTPWIKKPTSDDENYFQPSNSTLSQIFEGLVKYKDTSDFKRIALMMIAYTSSIDDIKFIRKTFSKMDTHETGSISTEEFHKAFSTFGKTESELDEIFKVIDVNDNGLIDYIEFLAATIETQGQIEEERLHDAFDRFDQDESGYIDKLNLRTILGTKYTKERLQNLLEESHADTDGHISYQDFCAAILNPSVAASNHSTSDLTDT